MRAGCWTCCSPEGPPWPCPTSPAGRERAPASGRTSGGGRAALGCRVAETVRRSRQRTGRRGRRRVLGLLAVLVPGLVACADLRRPEVEEVAVAFGAPGADPASRCA